jgi:hypothetical protein
MGLNDGLETKVVKRWNGAVAIGPLANWRAKRKGPDYQKFGTKVRYPVAGLESWEAARMVRLSDNNGDATASV